MKRMMIQAVKYKKRKPTVVVTLYDKEAEHIIAGQIIRGWGVTFMIEYLIKWKILQKNEASWELTNIMW